MRDDDNDDFWEELERAVQEQDYMTAKTDAEEPDPPILDPNNESWHLLPILRGADEIGHLAMLCQKYNLAIIGGYARYMCSPDPGTAPAGDIDLFFLKLPGEILDEPQERFEEAWQELNHLYDNLNQGPLSTYFFDEDTGNTGSLIAANLIEPRSDVNMITHGSVYEILEMFDFPVVRAAWLPSYEGHIIVDPDFKEDELKKSLHWKHINCPVAGIFRFAKYYKKGYFGRPREIVRLFQAWDELDDEYKTALVTALNRDDLSEEEIMDLERLLWVD